jgi:hypothetical protein
MERDSLSPLRSIGKWADERTTENTLSKREKEKERKRDRKSVREASE